MNKRKFLPPDTSIQAHNNVKATGQKPRHADIILNALKVRKEGTYESISVFCGLTSLQVVRRLKELETDNKIFRTGRYALTLSGSKAEIWRILETPQPNIQTSLFAA